MKQEKAILMGLQEQVQQAPEQQFIVKLYDTFVDEKDICLVFEYLPGQDLFWVLTNEHNLQLS